MAFNFYIGKIQAKENANDDGTKKLEKEYDSEWVSMERQKSEIWLRIHENCFVGITQMK